MFSKQNKRKNKWEVGEAISLESTGRIKGTGECGQDGSRTLSPKCMTPEQSKCRETDFFNGYMSWGWRGKVFREH